MNGYKTKAMKVVFVSNYFNHHQKPFCEELYRRFGSDFVFISTSVMREERRKLGYSQDESPDYLLLSYENEKQKNKAISLIKDADVVIAGAAPNDLLLERIRQGKLLFRYGERPYKVKASLLKRIYHFFHWRQRDLWKKNVYMLCAGGYVARDYASVGMYKNRMYKWGYFPEVKEYSIEQLLANKKRNTLLWCGRFIDWKHPDDAVLLAKKLKDAGYDFHLNMVGTGVMEEELKAFVAQNDLEEVVHFLGSMPPEEVRSYMEEAGIYLFTSDRQEGWGAVLNESMNSGCAVVASDAIGSVSYLIRHGENGFKYSSGNVDDLFYKVTFLLEKIDEQYTAGVAAYTSILDCWNADVAICRFLKLIDEICEHGSCNVFAEGPCSKE